MPASARLNELENVRIVRYTYEAFNRGDIQAYLNALADDVEWRVPRNVAIPYYGPRHGRQQVAGFFATVAETLEVEQFEPSEYIAQGDTVVVLGHERIKVKSTGRVFEQDWAHVYVLREGKIARVQLYEDTATEAAAFAAL